MHEIGEEKIATIGDWTFGELGYDFGVPRPVDIVIDFLTAEDARGCSQITLDDQARAFLNHLVKWRSGPPKRDRKSVV